MFSSNFEYSGGNRVGLSEGSPAEDQAIAFEERLEK